MAKSPSPKSNFIQALLFASVIFLGIQLFTAKRPSEFDTQNADQIRAALLQANKELKDQTIAHGIAPKYLEKLDAEVKAGRLKPEEFDRLKLEAAVIVADAQFKAGLARNDTNRIRTAYATLVGWLPRLESDAALNKPVAVTDTTNDSRFGWKEWAPLDLYKKSVDTLSERNQKELIWGFIPGGYQFIDFLVKSTGSVPAFSYAFAAFLLALVVRAAVYPLAQKQLMWSRQMTQLQPLAQEIRENFKDNPQEMNLRMMQLYKDYGINPLAGCGPALIQIPLFFTVYQCMLLYQFEFQKGTFLWINPASHSTNKFFAPNLGQLDFLLILIYGISMIATTMLSPVSDPSQLKQQRMIGIGFSIFATVSLFTGIFPVAGAFVLYWTFTNILATIQSLRAYRLPMPPLTKVNAAGGGVFPMDPTHQRPNGKPVDTGAVKTGTPAKHKPKKRK